MTKTFHDDLDVLDRLADGKKPRAIAEEIGCTYATVRKRITRTVHMMGFHTPEQAVANRVADRIQAAMPLALKSTVDLVMKRRR